MENWKPKVKIYGERNTGTNYLYDLIDHNLKVNLFRGVVSQPFGRIAGYSPFTQFLKDRYFQFTFADNLGWKHSLPHDPAFIKQKIKADDLLFITITKNPYSWLLSLFRRPFIPCSGCAGLSTQSGTFLLECGALPVIDLSSTPRRRRSPSARPTRASCG